MFRVLGFILRYLPVIFTAVRTVEELTSPETTGAEKKVLVLGALKDVLGGVGVELGEAAWEVAARAIDTVVAVLNLLGVFGHREEEGQAAAPVTAAQARAAAEKAVAADPALEAFLRATAR